LQHREARASRRKSLWFVTETRANVALVGAWPAHLVLLVWLLLSGRVK
jgi:hypothetical protein